MGKSDRMPVLFIGHGSPENAIDSNPFTEGWKDICARITRPKLILAISAHWVTDGTAITAMDRPKTIHDFYGFQKALYEAEYPAKGAPTKADEIRDLIHSVPVALDKRWGLDHGTWSVLMNMYPKADIPVLQLSLDANLSMEGHLMIGEELAQLRDERVLIIGSGNIVHNLREIRLDSPPFPWAIDFDQRIRKDLEKRDGTALADYTRHGSALHALPTNEHYLPLLYAVGASRSGKPIFFNEGFFAGSVSMRCVAYGIG